MPQGCCLFVLSHVARVVCTGVYLCVKAYGEANLTYSLRATLSQCPADFTKEGEQLLCSSPLHGPASEQRYSQCLSDGTCVCNPPYNKPVEDVYPCEAAALSSGFKHHAGLHAYCALCMVAHDIVRDSHGR